MVYSEIFDMERLIHALDSTEGLIVRYQYLDIPMSVTEQASLFSKYGDQLQNSVTSRFDRLEHTLEKMERFLDFQKPIFRLDIFLDLVQKESSATIGEELLRFDFHGIQSIDGNFIILAKNLISHPKSNNRIIFGSLILNQNGKQIELPPSMSNSATNISIYHEIQVGQRTSISNLTKVYLSVMCTEGILSKINRVFVDINGYEFFNFLPKKNSDRPNLKWPENYSGEYKDTNWFFLHDCNERNLLFYPPQRSLRFSPIHTV